MTTTNDVITAVKTVVTTATGISEAYSYIPVELNSEEILFIYQEPPTDEIKSNNLTRRTYNIMIWCLVSYQGIDDTNAEVRFNDLTDQISLALIRNKTLSGVVRSTELADVQHNPLVEISKVIYRVRLWSLGAWVDMETVFS